MRTLLYRLDDDLRVVVVCLAGSALVDVDDDHDERDELTSDGDDEKALWIFFSCVLRGWKIHF